MDLNEFSSQIEEDINIRLSEIQKLKNTCNTIPDTDTKKILRKAAICLFYSHIEGFVYFIFSHYIHAINIKELPVTDVTHEIKAANYHNKFSGLLSNSKHPIFKKCLPDDSHLHKLYRQVEFFSDIFPSWYKDTVNISDNYINTESNVGKEVIQKLLYKVGLEHKSINRDLCSSLNRLLNARNDIAHGKSVKMVDDSNFEEYYQCSNKIMYELKILIIDAYQNNKFLL